MRSAFLRPANWLVILFALASASFAINVVFFPTASAFAQAAPLPSPTPPKAIFCAHGSLEDFKNQMDALHLKTLVLDDLSLEAFVTDLDILLAVGPAPDDIKAIALRDPASLGDDVKLVTMGFYDGDGCLLGTSDWRKELVVNGLKHDTPAMAPERDPIRNVISDAIMSAARA